MKTPPRWQLLFLSLIFTGDISAKEQDLNSRDAQKSPDVSTSAELTLLQTEIEVMRVQLSASEQRESMLRQQLLERASPRLVGETRVIREEPFPGVQPQLKAGVKLVYQLPCGAKREICFHRDRRWYSHDHHKSGKVDKQIPVLNAATPGSVFFSSLNLNLGLYQRSNGEVEIVEFKQGSRKP